MKSAAVIHKNITATQRNVPVAKECRAPALQAGGIGFKSLWFHQKKMGWSHAKHAACPSIPDT